MGNNNLIKYNRIPWVKALAIHLTHSNSETNRICSCDIHSQEKQQQKILQVIRMRLLCLCTNLTKIGKKTIHTLYEFTLSTWKAELSMLQFAKSKGYLWLQITSCTMLIQHFPSANTRNDTRSTFKALHTDIFTKY